MTREEAIKILEQRFDSSCRNNLFQNVEKLDYEDALWMAISALRSAPQPCKPLTLEQLREMDGKPVWCEDVERRAIVPVSDAGKWKDIPFALFEKNSTRFEWNIEGRELSLYSYPPAHIDRSKWTAEWVPMTDDDGCVWLECSACEYDLDSLEEPHPFCPSCGRAMMPEAWAELERRVRR